MEDLEQVTAYLSHLKGETLAMETMINAFLHAMPEQQLASTLREFDRSMEIAKVTLLNSDQAGEHVLRGFDAYVQRAKAMHQGR